MTSVSSGGSGAPAFILHLPIEVFGKICDDLTDDVASLARLGQTCRALHRLVAELTPILYRQLHDCGPEPLNLVALIRSLTADPSRRQYIQSIRLDHQSTPQIDDRTQSAYDAFCAKVRNLSGVDPSAYGEPKCKPDSAMIMAVICFTTNLNTIDITASEKWGTTDFLLSKSTMGRSGRLRTNGARYVLDSLINLTIHFVGRRPVDRKHGMTLHKLNGLLHATPNLESLVLDCSRGGTSLSARLPHLTTLRLTNSYLCNRGLRALTRACNSLVHFELTFDDLICARYYLPVSPSQVVECLQSCRATLETLHLGSYTPTGVQREVGLGPYPLLLTLGEFPGLKQVAIDCRSLERLPSREILVELVQRCRALERFSLTGMEDSWQREITCFTDAAVDVMQWPRLSMLKFQVQAGLTAYQDQQVLQQLQAQLQLGQPDDNATRLKRIGVEVLAVSGTAV